MENSFLAAKNSRTAEYLAYIFICLPPVIYFFVVNKFALNLPYYDDFPSILRTLNDYKTSDMTDRFFLLFRQHNDHRILFTRLITITYYTLFGSINFRGLIFIGNAQLIFILLISVHFIKKAFPTSWQLPSVLMSLFLFDLSNWNNADWAMASLQNHSVIFLFVASLFFYSLDSKKYLPLAVLFQVLCTFSSGNGVIASFCLVLYAIFSKDKGKMILSICTFLLFTVLYYVHYKPLSHAIEFRYIVISILQLTSGHFYIGMHRYNTYMMEALSILYFICILICFPFSKKMNIKKEYLPIICILVFILGSIAAIGSHRPVTGGIVPGRFLIYCNYLVGLIFLLAMMKLTGTKYLKSISILFTVLMVLCYARNFKVGIGGFKMWQQYVINNTPDPWATPEPVLEKAITDRSCDLGIYCIDKERMKLK